MNIYIDTSKKTQYKRFVNVVRKTALVAKFRRLFFGTKNVPKLFIYISIIVKLVATNLINLENNFFIYRKG